jgi:hypothetical protein
MFICVVDILPHFISSALLTEMGVANENIRRFNGLQW